MSTNNTSTKSTFIPTNLALEQLVMDCRGTRDPHYYCLPPMYADPARSRAKKWYLVFQVYKVGVFDNWPEAKTSVSGYPDAGYRGYATADECIDAWQKMCAWGVHPHPIDPACVSTPSCSATRFVNTSPRKGAPQSSAPVLGQGSARVKLEEKKESSAEILADFPILPAIARPSSSASGTSRGSSPVKGGGGINFAIRGGGVVSSSAEGSQQRYLDLQRRGEEPDLLVTRSVQQASLFALGEEDGESWM
ncbi:hypothetical protein C8R43DRAFT_1116289 [Mycena crocata]|nr:hypothetical protein C8R43DRAFT_1116289 [Mycena crocata]